MKVVVHGSVYFAPIRRGAVARAWPGHGVIWRGIWSLALRTVLTYLMAPHQYFTFHKASKGTFFFPLIKCESASQCSVGGAVLSTLSREPRRLASMSCLRH